MREYDLNDWYITLYEDIECENKEQLLKREGEVIREIGTLNKGIAGGSDTEYNKQTRKELYEKYKDKNKETQKNSVCVFYCHSNLVWTNLVGHTT